MSKSSLKGLASPLWSFITPRPTNRDFQAALPLPNRVILSSPPALPLLSIVPLDYMLMLISFGCSMSRCHLGQAASSSLFIDSTDIFSAGTEYLSFT